MRFGHLMCGRRVRRAHSQYERTLANLLLNEQAVTGRLRSHRMFCDNTRCERRIQSRQPDTTNFREPIRSLTF